MIEGAAIPTPSEHGPTAAPVAGRPRIALAHDWICGYRGGEAVLERIAALLDTRAEISRLYVMFDDGRPLAPTIDTLRSRRKITPAFINRLPGATPLRRWLLPLYPAAVDHLSLKLARHHAAAPIDLLISTSSAAIKGLRPPQGIPHICYCHSPARYIWSAAAEYKAPPARRRRPGVHARARLRALGLGAFRTRFKAWDRATAPNVTAFIANSTHTAALIRAAFHRDAQVIRPPVRTAYFTPAPPSAPAAPAQERDAFWLLVSALEPYKRIDLAIDAAKIAGKRLVISGKGSQREHLGHYAAESGAQVEFVGRTTDEQLRALYRSASLLIFPQVEDFGIVAAEALACGLPVVARNAGGAVDIVQDGITGALFDDPTPQAIAAAAARAPHNPQACTESAQRFSEAEFDRRMLAVIDEALERRRAGA